MHPSQSQLRPNWGWKIRWPLAWGTSNFTRMLKPNGVRNQTPGFPIDLLLSTVMYGSCNPDLDHSWPSKQTQMAGQVAPDSGGWKPIGPCAASQNRCSGVPPDGSLRWGFPSPNDGHQPTIGKQSLPKFIEIFSWLLLRTNSCLSIISCHLFFVEHSLISYWLHICEEWRLVFWMLHCGFRRGC